MESEDHERSEAKTQSRVIEELNECVPSASVDVEDSFAWRVRVGVMCKSFKI